jgi:hypothetical protein
MYVHQLLTKNKYFKELVLLHTNLMYSNDYIEILRIKTRFTWKFYMYRYITNSNFKKYIFNIV